MIRPWGSCPRGALTDSLVVVRQLLGGGPEGVEEGQDGGGLTRDDGDDPEHLRMLRASVGEVHDGAGEHHEGLHEGRHRSCR